MSESDLELKYGEALKVAEKPKEAIALALVLLGRIADSLDRLADWKDR